MVKGRPAEKEEAVDGRHRAILACCRVAQLVGPGAMQRVAQTVSFCLGRLTVPGVEDDAVISRRRFCLCHAPRLVPHSLLYQWTVFPVAPRLGTIMSTPAAIGDFLPVTRRSFGAFDHDRFSFSSHHCCCCCRILFVEPTAPIITAVAAPFLRVSVPIRHLCTHAPATRRRSRTTPRRFPPCA